MGPEGVEIEAQALAGGNVDLSIAIILTVLVAWVRAGGLGGGGVADGAQDAIDEEVDALGFGDAVGSRGWGGGVAAFEITVMLSWARAVVRWAARVGKG